MFLVTNENMGLCLFMYLIFTPTPQLGQMVLFIFGLMVEYSFIRFSIYSVLLSRSTDSAQSKTPYVCLRFDLSDGLEYNSKVGQ